MRTLVVGSPDLRDASVGRDDQHRRQVTLESAIEPREALDVQHVHLVGGVAELPEAKAQMLNDKRLVHTETTLDV